MRTLKGSTYLKKIKHQNEPFMKRNLQDHQLNRFCVAIRMTCFFLASASLTAFPASSAFSEEIIYLGNNSDLKADPTGNTSLPKSSLFPSSAANNSVTVGNKNATTQESWNTNSTPQSAPYVIYGGVDVRGAGGGASADIYENKIFISNVQYDWSGQTAPDAEKFSSGNGGDVGGMGGGSVYGGLSIGGNGGNGTSRIGGNGGSVYNNHITLNQVSLGGAAGGTGGSRDGGNGGGGVGGMGGGSIYGGLSIGGAGGGLVGHGGDGGAVYNNYLSLSGVTLIGSKGGDGGSTNASSASGGVGGMGGGSVYGGLSIGGASGLDDFMDLTPGEGGASGSVIRNHLILNNVTLIGSTAGIGGAGDSYMGGNGLDGLNGGSIYGGASLGGAGGDQGGASGNVTDNTIVLSGTSSISGDIYGGYTRGGAANIDTDTLSALGGNATNNTVTLEGSDLTIAGSVYGGYSVDGDGTVQNSRAFTGNTLNLYGYRGSLTGIYNFENYNWILPKDVVNNDTLIRITGTDKVQLDNTQHTVAMENDGTRLNAGDIVTLIDKAEGTPTLTTKQIKQGHFIIYDASLKTSNDALVLSIDGKQDSTPAGRINPTSKAFLEGRAASLAFTNQGADLISDYGISAAGSSVKRAQREGINLTPFVVVNGGSSRYNTGSHVDVRGFNMLFGVATGLELQDQSAITLGVFAERGDGNYDSYNHFSDYGSVHGTGNVRYTGGGALFHMDVAGTALSKKPSSVERGHEGLYLDGSVRTGNADMSFDSNDLTDAEGVRGKYNRKSKYYGAHGGVGYVLNIDEKQSVDVYSRYTWTRLDAEKVNIGKDKLSFNTSESSRLRLGSRYTYAYTQKIKPYVGAAYEHEFKGDVSGSAYDLSIEKPSLNGNTGIFEVGVSMNPLGSDAALSIDLGLQGYVGEREGAAGTIKAKYAF
ncbi:autotransporter outer membrane beta-barrel domain-containing protein [Pseudomonas protegens]|uniref:autotransporter outer membrane beta-barrel domain-containing protein n=1 Tax=Pseudomonas protegens TaxID=380021 RepID=UPI00384ACB45